MQTALGMLLVLLVFQNALELLWAPLAYLDELAALAGAAAWLYDVAVVRRGRIARQELALLLPLGIFAAAGLAGNLAYGYQPWKSVAVDLFTNLKFFFAMALGLFCFGKCSWNALGKSVGRTARLCVLVLVLVFVADRLWDLFPAEERYGIRSARLFYFHPTHLAAATAFLMVALTVFYEKKNLPLIVLAAILCLFTLRAKAIASVAVYAAMFVFFIVWRKTLKWWHAAALGLACVLLAWPQIRFYFIELSGHSARSVLLLTSFAIMKDYFPIGTGFATYASSEAAKHYSPVYRLYDLHLNWELRDIHDTDTAMEIISRYEYLQNQYAQNPQIIHTAAPFLNDSFWPIIFGQTGVLGSAAYLLALLHVIRRCLTLRDFDVHAYTGVLFALAYLFVSSAAEPAFNNALAVPLALIIGIVLCKAQEHHT